MKNRKFVLQIAKMSCWKLQGQLIYFLHLLGQDIVFYYIWDRAFENISLHLPPFHKTSADCSFRLNCQVPKNLLEQSIWGGRRGRTKWECKITFSENVKSVFYSTDQFFLSMYICLILSLFAPMSIFLRLFLSLYYKWSL